MAKFNLRDDPVAFLQNLTYPPVEDWLAINVIVDSVLSSLHRVAFLQDREFHLQSRTILPLDTYLPAFCGTLVLHLPMMVSEHLVGVGVSGQAAPVVAILIKHVVHLLSNLVESGAQIMGSNISIMHDKYLVSRRIGLCPQRPVWSAAYSL